MLPGREGGDPAEFALFLQGYPEGSQGSGCSQGWDVLHQQLQRQPSGAAFWGIQVLR